MSLDLKTYIQFHKKMTAMGFTVEMDRQCLIEDTIICPSIRVFRKRQEKTAS